VKAAVRTHKVLERRVETHSAKNLRSSQSRFKGQSETDQREDPKSQENPDLWTKQTAELKAQRRSEKLNPQSGKVKLHTSDYAKLKSGAFREEFSRCEPQPLHYSILQRRSGKYRSLPKERSGIEFHQASYNNVRLVNETYVSMVYLYQLCRYSFTNHEYNLAKQSYHMFHRFLQFNWKIYYHSKTVQQFWNVISITLRLKGEICNADRSTTKVVIPVVSFC